MKRTILILSTLALVASSCNLKKQQSVEENNQTVVEQEEVQDEIVFESDNSESKNSAKQFDFSSNTCYDFEGVLGDAPIQLSICMGENPDYLTGSYCYKKYENKIRLAGEFNGDQLELNEFLNDKINGHFKGKIFRDDTERFEGIWTDASGKKQLEFKLISMSYVGYTSPNQRYSDYSASDEEIENFMKKIKLSIANDDKEWIAAHTRYPLKTTLNGQEKITIKNKQQLIDNFEQIFYPAYKEEIKKHCVCNMFYNPQGIMLGNGEIWIGKNVIIAINN